MESVKFDAIHVAVDNSDHSNVAIDLGVTIGSAFGAHVVGSHVYAAKLHDVRFKQMEFTLPDEYKEDTELEKQRRIHDALITRGLQLISDSYLDGFDRKAQEANVSFERKMFDGRTFEPLMDDLVETQYDLLILGALGQGAVKDSDLGSVVERLLRRTELDTLVVRDLESADEAAKSRNIDVLIDGSTWSWGGLHAAISLAQATQRSLHIVTAANATDPARELLNQHGALAVEVARAAGVEADLVSLEGEPTDALLAHFEQSQPWMAVIGRHGNDANPSDASLVLGSTTDVLLRQAACNLLVTSRKANAAGAVAGADNVLAA